MWLIRPLMNRRGEDINTEKKEICTKHTEIFVLEHNAINQSATETQNTRKLFIQVYIVRNSPPFFKEGVVVYDNDRFPHQTS
jgi:hypothetical protein